MQAPPCFKVKNSILALTSGPVLGIIYRRLKKPYRQRGEMAELV